MVTIGKYMNYFQEKQHLTKRRHAFHHMWVNFQTSKLFTHVMYTLPNRKRLDDWTSKFQLMFFLY